jgi:yersiniabactin nonribosomal peptide synthetase
VKDAPGSLALTTLPVAEQLCEAARRWQDRPCFTSDAGSLTYGEAREAMLAIAGWLRRRHGLEPGQRVALCLPTGTLAGLFILGALAAGASYIPLQHNGPAERLRAILASVEPHLLLTTEAMAGRLAPAAPPSLGIATIDPTAAQLAGIIGTAVPISHPVPIDPRGLAAIYFTSGSTGEPKGVMFSHRGMAASILATAAIAEVSGEDRLIALSGLHYAASLKLFTPFLLGCRSYVATDEEAMAPERLAAILERERTTIWHATATQLRQLVEGGRLESRDLGALHGIRLFGERAPISVLRRAMDLVPHAGLKIGYGATEAFAMLSCDLPRPLPADYADQPLGWPTDYYAVFLRDQNGAEVPPGEIGEICAVGPAVTMGYWKRPDLTAAARVEGMADSYRSGDLARIDPDGCYHFAGRVDHQVKIRGHRFELGEIEAALKSHAEVRDAIAFLSGDEGAVQEVRACVLSDRGGSLVSELLAICLQRLPVFARPGRILVLDHFPLLPSGKVDRMALQRLGSA